MERRTLMYMRDGMHASSGHTNTTKRPALLKNLDINAEGRLECRKGVRYTGLFPPGEGTQLAVTHFLGNDDHNPQTNYFRFPFDATWTTAGRRGFVAIPGGENKWYDLRNGDEYDWRLPKPAGTVQVTLDTASISQQGFVDAISNLEISPNPYFNESSIRFQANRPILIRLVVRHAESKRVIHYIIDHHGRYTFFNPGIYEYRLGTTGVLDDEFSLLVDLDLIDDQDNEEQQFRRVSVERVDSSDFNTPEDIELYLPDDLKEAEGLGELNESETGGGFQGGWYSFCYTFYSEEFGIESPPSRVIKQFLPSFPRLIGQNGTFLPSDSDSGELIRYSRNPVPLDLGAFFGTAEIEDWVDTIRFYAARGRFPEYDVEAKELPYGFDLISEVKRGFWRTAGHDPGTRIAFYKWRNESLAKDDFGEELNVTLVSQGFESDPPISNLDSIALHAGRIWGYDKTLNAVRFSLIDGAGTSNWDVFPYEDSEIPHGITLLGSWQATAHKITTIPTGGGLYVFYRDAIRTILGESIVTGLFSTEVGARTDIDASGGISGIGSMSPRAIVEFNNRVIFLASDRKIYGISNPSMSGLDENISRPIQYYLDQATDDELRVAFAFRFGTKYFLHIAGTFYVFDTEYDYWTTYEYGDEINGTLTDGYWSRGGVDDESILYGLTDTRLIYSLEEGDPDSVEWEILSNWMNVPSYEQVNHVYCMHDSEEQEFTVRVDVDGVNGTPFMATPTLNDQFKVGVNAGLIGNRMRVNLSGTGECPNFREISVD